MKELAGIDYHRVVFRAAGFYQRRLLFSSRI